jgi:Leucine-rich repeat (LRR) protein
MKHSYHLSCFLASATLLLLSLSASGQNLTFQDARFKLYLTSGNCVDLDGNGTGDDDADLNNDGEIQVSEALVVTRLKVGDPQITSYSGIEGFSNLEYLDCSWSTLLPTLDIQGLPLI